MSKGVLKFLTYFTNSNRLRYCIKNKSHGILLDRRYPSNSTNYHLVGRLYLSEHNAYIVVSPWHQGNFDKLIKPYAFCTKVLAYQVNVEGITCIYHITGIRNKDYVSDFKEN